MCLSDESNSVILRLESHPSINFIKNPSNGLSLFRKIAHKRNTIHRCDGWHLEFISGAVNKDLGSLEGENKIWFAVPMSL